MVLDLRMLLSRDRGSALLFWMRRGRGMLQRGRPVMCWRVRVGFMPQCVGMRRTAALQMFGRERRRVRQCTLLMC